LVGLFGFTVAAFLVEYVRSAKRRRLYGEDLFRTE
jgi:hypothetical protein